MRVAVAFGVLATIALAYGAPHGVFPHTIGFVDQKLIGERVKPVYGYRVRTSTAHEHPFAFGYKIKAEAPVVIHSEESAEAEGHSVGSGGFNYAFKTVAPVATPVAVGGVIATPVTFSSRKITERILGQESAEGESSAADTVKVHGDSYLSVGPSPVAVTYERTLHHASSKAQGEGSFSYSYHADSPVVSAVPAAVFPASVAAVKSGEVSDNSGSFAYSVTADAPVVAPATFVAAAPLGVAVEHRTAGFGEKISDDKASGSFSYSYHADAPILTAPVVHHSVVAAPVPITSFVNTEEHVEDKGSRGAFSYSVTADAPWVGHSAAAVEAAQVVDTKSVETQVNDKSSGSFSYSFNAEAPVAGAIAAPIVAAPVHTAYIAAARDEANIANRGSFSYSVTADAPVVAAPVHTAYTSVVQDEANIANRGSFSYSITADAPVVAPVSYVASAPVGVSYEHTVVDSGEKISDDKSSGAFAYSYSVDQPAVVAPVVHHSVVAAPAYTGSFVKSVDHVEDTGSRGAFSYSVTADAPLVGHSAAVVEAAQVVDTKSADTKADDKSSGSFSYSFSAEAPIRSAVVAPVVAAPVQTAYTTSVVKDEAAQGNRGSFSYSVTADAPVSYVASAPIGVEYDHTVVQYGDKISDEKSSGAFGYSYHVDAPAVVAPFVHHSVITQPAQTESLFKTVEYSQGGGAHGDVSSVHESEDVSSGSGVDSQVETKTVGVDSVEKPSGAFSYSFSAEAPLRAEFVAPVVAAPVHTAYIAAARDEANIANRGSFSYSVTADAPVVAAPVHTAYTSVVQDEANIANRGSFSYSITADAPVVAPVSYVASAPVGVSYEHTVVDSGEKISDDKSSGAFAYSYSVDQPAVVAPVVHHSVVAAPAYTGSFVKSVDHVEDTGSRGAFSYSVTADAPLVGHSAAVVEAAQVVDTKSADTHADDKSSGSFSYSFNAEAPVAAAVVPAPVHTAYTTSIVNDEAALGNRGSFSYSVTADAPVIAPVSYVASAPVGVEYEQAVVHYGDKIADHKGSGAFGYSIHLDTPTLVAPVAHHAVVSQPLHTESIVKTVDYSDAAAHGDAHFESKTVDASSEGKSSGSFSYSINAEAPVTSVGAPVFHSSSVVGAVPVEVRGSFLKTNYVHPISAASFGVTADDLKLHSIGSFDRVYGVRTAPVNTFVSGVQHAPLGYGVPITIKCD